MHGIHSIMEIAPVLSEYEPGGQGRQAVLLFAPFNEEYVPLGHNTHDSLLVEP